MHTRRLVAFLLGAWMFGTGFMTYVAIHNLRNADQSAVVESEQAPLVLRALGPENTRLLLRHQASLLNREYFERWEQTEIFLGIVIVFWLVFATQRRWLPVALGVMALVLAGWLHFVISPEINFIAKAIDFMGPLEGESQRQRIWALHQVYAVGTLVKLMLCGILTAYLLWFRARKVTRKRVISELDASDDTHYTHVTS